MHLGEDNLIYSGQCMGETAILRRFNNKLVINPERVDVFLPIYLLQQSAWLSHGENRPACLDKTFKQVWCVQVMQKREKL